MTPATNRIVDAARAWLGTPYRHQASTLGAGCDCLGLVRGVWRGLYGSEPLALPNYSADWRDTTQRSLLLEAATTLMVPIAAGGLQPGHMVLFRLQRTLPPRHCGIIVGRDRFIHAQERLGVVEANLTESWQRRLAGSFAFPEVES